MNFKHSARRSREEDFCLLKKICLHAAARKKLAVGFKFYGTWSAGAWKLLFKDTNGKD